MSNSQISTAGALVDYHTGLLWQEGRSIVLADDVNILRLAGSYTAGDNSVWSIAGTGAADADGTFDPTTGGFLLTSDGSGGSADDECAMILNADSTMRGAIAATVAKHPAFLTLIRTPATITEYQILVGLGSDDNADAPYDAGGGEVDAASFGATSVFGGFTYDTDDSDDTNGKWRVVFKDTGTVTASRLEYDSPVDFEASTWYFIKCWVDADAKMQLLIQNLSADTSSYKYTTAALATSTNRLGGTVGISSLTTVDNTVSVVKPRFACDLI
jgi:hypothetical protein